MATEAKAAAATRAFQRRMKAYAKASRIHCYRCGQNDHTQHDVGLDGLKKACISPLIPASSIRVKKERKK